jgi:hypothetical protein
MKARNIFMVFVCLVLCRIPICEAGQFINLGFEDANYSGDPKDIYSGGLVSDLLAGWRLFYGTNEQFVVGFNSPGPLEGGGRVATVYNWSLFPPLAGQYSFLVGNSLGGPRWVLEQRGEVPANAQLLSYRGSVWYAPWTVEVNGTEIPRIPPPLSAFTTNVFFYNIADFAGKSVTLDFLSNGGAIDSITFSAPETVFGENDFNSDGVRDVVFEHKDGFIGVWFMNKGPDLASASFFNPKAVDPRWHIVGTGNFRRNNTNKTDLLFQHEDGSLAVWSMHGTNLFEPALLNPSQPGDGWKVVGTGDLNHDGKKDILFQHTDGTLGVWFMDGINLMQGTLLNPNKPGDSGWRVAGTAELSSVGNTDLILQHTDGTLAAWYLDGINLVRREFLNPAAPGEAGWRVATTLDLNGDGKTDLLFQHANGRVAVWLMDGINLISSEYLIPENPGAGWRIAGPR